MRETTLFFPLGFLLFFSFCFSCTDMVPTREVRAIDSLNGKSYVYRYRDLDSSYYYAELAYHQVNLYKSGKAEALNNLGFCSFMKMDFDCAENYHKEVYKQTKNELELFIADIGLMKICQRTAMNKEFYDYRNSALHRMKRIREESDLFIDRHDKMRLDYAFSEFYIVSSIYYYYLQQREEAAMSLDQISQFESLKDTSQLLYFHYIKGSASPVNASKLDEHRLRVFDQLYYTWSTATQSSHPYLYFQGNGLQGLADLMIFSDQFEFYKQRRLHSLESFGLPVDTLLPLHLGQMALEKFRRYNDLYQIADAYVTIGRYLNAHGRYKEALDTLTKALDCVNYHHVRYYHNGTNTSDRLSPYVEGDTTYTGVPWIDEEQVKTVPEWISRIREQLSVSYMGLGMKKASDYNRNIYLDILNYTRQDKELESRLQSLEAGSRQMTLVLSLVLIGLLFVIILWWFLNKRSKIRNQIDIDRLQQILSLCRDITSSIPMNVPLIQAGIDQLFGKGRLLFSPSDTEGAKAEFIPLNKLSGDEKALLSVLKPYIEWASDNEKMLAELSDERIQFEKQRYIYEQHIASNKRQNIIKKSCLAIVNGIQPYIDRILNEVHKLTEKGFIKDENIKKEKFQYIEELVTTINEYNDILALWIKMKQGSINLNIESFNLNELFELLSKGRRSFEMKKLDLQIRPTQAVVKADRALTLFMINTLAENARKYTPEGGVVRIYAEVTSTYVEISVEDTGEGISSEDIAHILGEKVYDSSTIGLKDTSNPERLKADKGSGFGLMNCKGIIEKYRKTNDLFRICLFSIESEKDRGSRFFFRLPLGVKKIFEVFLFAFFSSLLFVSCVEASHISSEVNLQSHSLSFEENVDSLYESYFQAASDAADLAYLANVKGKYEEALFYIQKSMDILNAHYRKYARPSHSKHYMTLSGQGVAAEIGWWNDFFDTDYHIILDIRNEAAVAFLALKKLDAYSYNNTAYTDLYKLHGEDMTLEGDCRLLERSNTNKTVGIILCFILLLISLIGYYFLYMRKRLQNRLNLEQVLEINQKVFAASLCRSQENNPAEALQCEETVFREIPKHMVDEAFGAVDELLAIHRMGIAVYNESTHQLEYASYPQCEMPDIVQRCFDNQQCIIEQQDQALPLMVEVGENAPCVGVLYLERREGSEQEADLLLFELIGRYVSIVIFNSVVKLANKYRDIESAHEEARRASWEDSMLHVQNMVLDNCLSTIKHETLYYPNKIKLIIGKLNTVVYTAKEELEAIQTITELIEYYQGIFTILSGCAARQLEEVTFRRSVITVRELFDGAEKYFRKAIKNRVELPSLQFIPIDASIIGDLNQLRFLFENLIDEALSDAGTGKLYLCAQVDDAFVQFSFTDTRCSKTIDELNHLFYPSSKRMVVGDRGELRGTAYLICKQIIRDHDEFAGRRGCRINAIPAENGGFTIYFTLPRRE